MVKHFFRFACLGILLVSLLVTLLASFPSTAHAATGLLNCTGTTTASYSPGLTNTPQLVAVTTTETYAPCLVPGDTNIISGSTTFTVIQTASCAVSFSLTAPTTTYTWNTGATSTVTFATTTVTRLADDTTNVTSVGTVIAGFGLGSIAVREKLYPQLDITACASPGGLTHLSGVTSLTFTL